MKPPHLAFHALLAISPLLTDAAQAAVKPVTIDFGKQSLSLEGVYKRPKGEVRSGLDAELEARRDGIARLREVLEKSCQASGMENQIAPDWQAVFRSQGSVIHPDHTLRLMLQAPIKSLFKDLPGGAPIALKGKTGKPLVLKVGPIAAAETACAYLTLKVGATNAKIFLAPAQGVQDPEVVDVKLDAAGTLTAATPEGSALLESSDLAAQLAQSSDKIPVIPVR